MTKTILTQLTVLAIYLSVLTRICFTTFLKYFLREHVHTEIPYRTVLRVTAFLTYLFAF